MYRELYTMKVIIVDDEAKILNHIVTKVKRVNDACDIVATAQNGHEALEKVEKYRPHIVLTDIKMPDMDGLELAREIKRRFPSIFVVIISGFSDFSLAQQAIQYGVFNYLLKPVEEYQLKDTLHDIQNKLESVMVQNQRSIIYPKTQNEASQVKHQVFKTDKYGLFILCFNNLCYDNLDQVLVDYYNQEMDKINWGQMLSELNIHRDWMIIDDYAINQKCLLCGLPAHTRISLEGMAKGMRLFFKRKHPTIMVNLCCHHDRLNRDQIWLYVQRMRNILQHYVVLTKPALYVLEKYETKIYNTDRLYNIKMRMDKHLKNHVKAKNYDKGYQEIKSILQYLAKVKMNQKQYEKVLIRMLQLYELYCDGYDTMLSEKYQIELFRTLSVTNDYKNIERDFFKCIDNFMNSIQTLGKSNDIQREIINYVNKHYMRINKVEDVATVFNYNYTYLSRLFKKMTGTTMIKYITAKRVEAAKNMMKQNIDMSLGTISDMVGYTDQHYFSRTFKLITGVSPSEYRDSLE